MPCSLLCYVTGILAGGNDIMLLHTYCRVGPTAGWALLQGGPYCSLGSGVLRSVHSLVPHPTKTQFKIQAIMTQN